MRDLNNINDGIWMHRYYAPTKSNSEGAEVAQGRVAESKFYLHNFTKPASKIFDKRRNIKDRLKKKRNVERSISKIIEGNLNINILVNIDTSSEEMELLSEILENNDTIYFPKIEIYIRHNILIIPVFQTSKIIEHIAGRPDSHLYSYSPEYDFVGNYGSGFFIIDSANKKEKERYNVKGK